MTAPLRIVRVYVYTKAVPLFVRTLLAVSTLEKAPRGLRRVADSARPLLDSVQRFVEITQPTSARRFDRRGRRLAALRRVGRLIRNLMCILTVAVAFGSPAAAYSRPELSVRFCRVMKDLRRGSLTPRQICERNGGSFCLSADSVGKGICFASGGSFCSSVRTSGQGICEGAKGSFCSSLVTTASGICAALDESFCSSRGAGDEDRLWRKLEAACGI